MKHLYMIFVPIYGDYNFKGTHNESENYGWHLRDLKIEPFAVGYKTKDKEQKGSWIRIKVNGVEIYDSSLSLHSFIISRGSYLSDELMYSLRNILSRESIEIEKYACKKFIKYQDEEYGFLSEEELRAKKTWEWQQKSIIAL